MKKRGLNLRNKVVRGVTYTSIFLGAEFTVFIMLETIIEKLFF